MSTAKSNCSHGKHHCPKENVKMAHGYQSDVRNASDVYRPDRSYSGRLSGTG